MNQASKSAGEMDSALYPQYLLLEPIELILAHKKKPKNDVGHFVP